MPNWTDILGSLILHGGTPYDYAKQREYAESSRAITEMLKGTTGSINDIRGGQYAVPTIESMTNFTPQQSVHPDPTVFPEPTQTGPILGPVAAPAEYKTIDTRRPPIAEDPEFQHQMRRLAASEGGLARYITPEPQKHEYRPLYDVKTGLASQMVALAENPSAGAVFNAPQGTSVVRPRAEGKGGGLYIGGYRKPLAEVIKANMKRVSSAELALDKRATPSDKLRALAAIDPRLVAMWDGVGDVPIEVEEALRREIETLNAESDDLAEKGNISWYKKKATPKAEAPKQESYIDYKTKR